MTILRVGSNEQYANNWDEAFGQKKKKTAKASSKSTAKKKTAKKKSTKKKS